GDRNNQFFHHAVKLKRQKLHLSRIRREDGQWITSSAEIEQEAVHAYQKQLNGQSSSQGDILLNSIPQLISADDNNMLCDFPSLEEIKEVVFEMNGSSAAGPDGFTGHFYTHCWDIIKGDF